VWELPPGDTLAAYVIFTVAFVAALAYMIRVARMERSLWPLYLFLGAGLAVVYEPINNVLGLCAYPEINQPTWISALGRRIPVYIGLVYYVYWSAPVLWLVRRIQAGITAVQWWRWYAGFTVVVTCFELAPLARGWWTYYGAQQPLVVLGFPTWWWIVNSQAIFGLGALVHLLRRHLLTDDRRALLLIPVMPLLLFAVHGGAGIPVFLALNTTTEHVVNDIAGIASIGIALMNMWLFSITVVRRPASAPPQSNVRKVAS
jgi:hypothetical protein